MRFLLVISFFCFFLFTSCSDALRRESISKNDTTNSLKILIDSVITLPRLADLNLLRRNNPFNDSAIVLKDTVFYKHFQKLGVKAKFLTGDSICALAVEYNKKALPFPNYVEFLFHRDTDSTYSASLRNMTLERINFYDDQTDYRCLFVSDDFCTGYAYFKEANNQTIIKITTDPWFRP